MVLRVCRRAQSKCNVWVWCPLTSGCSTGNGTFPYLGCQLKYQAGLSTSASSTAQPDAWERGPPTSFVSGGALIELLQCLAAVPHDNVHIFQLRHACGLQQLTGDHSWHNSRCYVAGKVTSS